MACCIYAVLFLRTLLSPFLWVYAWFFDHPHTQRPSAAEWTPSVNVAMASAEFAARPNRNNKHERTE